ncbi:hypothetical protein LSTR_LSTR017472 [Laodelphax striatellus]|uniref:Secreted protein n=1 Tax=Laodelphax striatellus TaxID=195883 RepID=A0A482X7N5_LAOST|nr:hypothetical protein LSTR_LSTR017472 [Laodelphax striatellus]
MTQNFIKRKHPIRLLCQLLFFLVRSTFRCESRGGGRERLADGTLQCSFCVLGWWREGGAKQKRRDQQPARHPSCRLNPPPPTATIIAYFMSEWNDAEFGRRKSSSKALSTSPLPSKASSVAAAALQVHPRQCQPLCQ